MIDKLYHHPTGKVIAQGHNQRVQKSSLTLHGEMDCLESLGRIPNLIKVLSECTMYSTLSPWYVLSYILYRVIEMCLLGCDQCIASCARPPSLLVASNLQC